MPIANEREAQEAAFHATVKIVESYLTTVPSQQTAEDITGMIEAIYRKLEELAKEIP